MIEPEWEDGSDLRSPYEWRWTVGFPGGFHTQVLQVDYRPGDLGLEDAAKIGIHVWRNLVAPLLSSSADLAVQETIPLSPFPFGRTDVPPYSQGGQPHSAGNPDHSPVWVLHTVHTDRHARRPLYFPGTPARWVRDGVLTEEGANAHLTWGRAFILGLGECWSQGTLQAIRYQPAKLLGPIGEQHPDRYRKVLHVRVCTHTDRPRYGLGGS